MGGSLWCTFINVYHSYTCWFNLVISDTTFCLGGVLNSTKPDSRNFFFLPVCGGCYLGTAWGTHIGNIIKSHWEHGGGARMGTIRNTSGTIISKKHLNRGSSNRPPGCTLSFIGHHFVHRLMAWAWIVGTY